jgi:hypothetical protein
MWGVTHEEIVNLRFELQTNVLQIVCHEESIEILQYIVTMFKGRDPEKRKMVNHRDKHLGS